MVVDKLLRCAVSALVGSRVRYDVHLTISLPSLHTWRDFQKYMLANKYLNTLAPTYLVTDFTFSYQYQTKMRCHTKMSTTHRRGSESFDVSNA